MNRELEQLAIDAAIAGDPDAALQGFLLAEVIPPTCPACQRPLELFANGDNGPQDDRWTCIDVCGIEYPHWQFPLPRGYVRAARAAERQHAQEEQRKADREKLSAWNKAMTNER